jgi:hypothetical protein
MNVSSPQQTKGTDGVSLIVYRILEEKGDLGRRAARNRAPGISVSARWIRHGNRKPF